MKKLGLLLGSIARTMSPHDYVLVGLAGFPLLGGFLWTAAYGRWFVQTSVPIYVWHVVSCALYGLALWSFSRLRSECARSLRFSAIVLFWSVAGGWMAGGLALMLLDCAADPSLAAPAVIEHVEYKPRVVRVRISAPAPG